MALQQNGPSRSSASASPRSLRARAEELVGAPDEHEILAPLSPEHATQLLHELRVYQTELEMQNDELRRVQEALLASRTLYFNLYDLAPVGYLTLDDKNTILESNLAAATMLGGPRQVIKQIPFPHYIAADDQDAFYLYRNRLLAAGELQQLELRLVRRNGDIFWARLDASLAFDEETNQPLLLLTLVDIDELKRQAEAMRLSAIIVDAADEAIFTTTAGPEYTITSWNPGAAAIYGWTAAEAIGQSARMLASEYPGRDTAAVRHSIQASGAYTGEVIQTTKTGDRVYLDSRVVARKDEQGTIVGWISVNRDITAQKQAEEALRRTQRNLAQAQRIGKIGSWDWDVQHSTLFWSDELYRIFGVTADFPLTYASIEAMIHPDDRALNNARVQAVLAGDEPIAYQFRIVRPDGAIRQIEQHIVVEYGDSVTPARLIGIMQDITGRTQAGATAAAPRDAGQ